MKFAGIEDAHLDVAEGGIAQILVLAQDDLEDFVQASKVCCFGRVVRLVDLILHSGLAAAQRDPAADVEERVPKRTSAGCLEADLRCSDDS